MTKTMSFNSNFKFGIDNLKKNTLPRGTDEKMRQNMRKIHVPLDIGRMS